jgi:hypothetical protein
VAEASCNGEPRPITEDPLIVVQKNLRDIYHLAQTSYNELRKHATAGIRANGYKEAYMQEHVKLSQLIQSYNALGQENQYYKQRLIPEYEHVLHIQEEEIRAMNRDLQDSEARSLELERVTLEVEEYKRALANAADFISSRDRKIEELSYENKELGAAGRQSPDRIQSAGKRQRSDEIAHELSPQEHGTLEKKSRKRRQKLKGVTKVAS